MQIVKPIVEALFQLLVLFPFIWVYKQEINKYNAKYLIVFCLLFVLDEVVNTSLAIYSFKSLKWNWNWIGKTASIVWALLFVFTTKLINKKEIGWTNKIDNIKEVIVIVGILLVLRLATQIYFYGFNGRCDVETFVFQLTMPGIAQEIVYRGILLGLLNKVFIARFFLFNTKFGWALILTSILFGFIHGVGLNNSLMPQVNSQKFIMATALGFVLGFIKENAKSLIPSIILHNLWNLIVFWH